MSADEVPGADFARMLRLLLFMGGEEPPLELEHAAMLDTIAFRDQSPRPLSRMDLLVAYETFVWHHKRYGKEAGHGEDIDPDDPGQFNSRGVRERPPARSEPGWVSIRPTRDDDRRDGGTAD